jgi:excisionase family DNA binding protein
MEPGALDKKSAAAYLGVGLRTLERLIEQGQIPTVKVGRRRVVIRKEALDEFLKAREHRRGDGEGERGPSEASLSYPRARSPRALQGVAKHASVRR